jgi:excisionase family DNA binding protein
MSPDVGTAREIPNGRLAYSVSEMAQVIGIGRTLAWSLVRSGEMPSIRVGDRVLIRHQQLLDWLDAIPDRPRSQSGAPRPRG